MRVLPIGRLLREEGTMDTSEKAHEALNYKHEKSVR